jgi:hypothetical protein
MTVRGNRRARHLIARPAGQYPSWRILLVVALLASAAASAKAVDIWESLGPGHLGASFNEVSQQVALVCGGEAARQSCKVSLPAPLAFSGVQVTRTEAVFSNFMLEQVKVTLETKQYSDLLHALDTRYGAGEDRSFVAIAGMAADFVAGVFVWRTGSSTLVLEQYAGKIDHSVLTYGTNSSMTELVRKTYSYTRGARRDL